MTKFKFWQVLFQFKSFIIFKDYDHTITSREINGKFNVPTLGIFREVKILFGKHILKCFSHLFYQKNTDRNSRIYSIIIIP